MRQGARVWVAGTAPIEADGGCASDARAQAERCFSLIREALAEVGARPSDVVRTRMFITDPDIADAVGQAHRQFVAEGRPVATMVVVKALLDPRWQVEIEAEAQLPDGD